MDFIDLIDRLKIKKNDVISVIGAGGKTTLINHLAQSLSKQNKKVLITTTTHIIQTKIEDFSHPEYIKNSSNLYHCPIFTFETTKNTNEIHNIICNAYLAENKVFQTEQSEKNKNDFASKQAESVDIGIKSTTQAKTSYIFEQLDNYIDILGRYEKNPTYINGRIKLAGINLDEFDLSNYYATLVEADGSKRLRLKGWRSFEPVIPPETTKTILVQDISYLDKKLNADDIFNSDIFARDFMSNCLEQKFSFLHIIEIINYIKKIAQGEFSVIFIDKNNSTENYQKVADFIEDKCRGTMYV